jgi:hypothetical protein
MSKVVLTQVATGSRRLLFLGGAEWAGGEGWPSAPSRRPRGAGGPPACGLKGQIHDTKSVPRVPPPCSLPPTPTSHHKCH